jgi:hypothetical protein
MDKKRNLGAIFVSKSPRKIIYYESLTRFKNIFSGKLESFTYRFLSHQENTCSIVCKKKHRQP